MAIIALCLKSPKDKLSVAKMALTSAFTCIGGNSTDQVRFPDWSSKHRCSWIGSINFVIKPLLFCTVNESISANSGTKGELKESARICRKLPCSVTLPTASSAWSSFWPRRQLTSHYSCLTHDSSFLEIAIDTIFTRKGTIGNYKRIHDIVLTFFLSIYMAIVGDT